MLNRAEQDRCYARGGAAGSSLLASTVVELPKSRPNGLRMTLTFRFFNPRLFLTLAPSEPRVYVRHSLPVTADEMIK
jgi:hypothetical protein